MMACGTDLTALSQSEKAMLAVIQEEAKTADDIATESKQPIFKVRSGMRSLVEREFAQEEGEAYRATEKTIARLKKEA